LSAYPKLAARGIEAAQQKGDGEVALGPDMYNARVIFNEDHGPWQRIGRGRRGVRRVVLPSADVRSCSLWVLNFGRGWQMVDASAIGAEEKSVALPSSSVIHVEAVAMALAEGRGLDPAEDDVEADAEAAAEAAAEATRRKTAGLVAIWEWCHQAGVDMETAGTLPDCLWGVYSREQNENIERDFINRCRQTDLEVGIRSYQIIFQRYSAFAWQVDAALRRKRLVRRRLLPLMIMDKRFGAETAATLSWEQTLCSLCHEPFAETAQMPLVELPVCRHTFRQACVQPCADEDQSCPICRQDVDWFTLGLQQ